MDTNLPFFVLAGFLAQIVDGALGMAYGVVSTSICLSFGIAPAVASASVHTSELFTSAASAFCHFKAGNIDTSFLKRLVVPGILGGILGAYVLSSFSGDVIKPWISLYLLIMGVSILVKAFRKHRGAAKNARLAPLGFFGGFVDAVGGGGWGPIVTSTLVAKGNSPRFVIGSVNSAEFFVALATSLTFFVTIGSINLSAVVGLVIGGLLAAPVAAVVCRVVQPKPLMAAVGVLIVVLSLRSIDGIPRQIAQAQSVIVAVSAGTLTH